MLEGLYAAAAGMVAQQQRLDAVSNDVANVSTSGYKRARVGFRDLVYDQAPRSALAGTQRGAGAAATSLGRTFAQGALQRTNQPLDVALQGPGFFQVQRPDGTLALTRDGAFRPDAQGRLRTADGSTVVPGVVIPRGVDLERVSIAADGQVNAGGRAVGRIGVVDVRAPQALGSTGDGYFTPTAASGAPVPVAGARVEQGTLEASNVDLGESMVDMIDAQRSFQFASKAIQMQDQIMEIANGVKR